MDDQHKDELRRALGLATIAVDGDRATMDEYTLGYLDEDPDHLIVVTFGMMSLVNILLVRLHEATGEPPGDQLQAIAERYLQ
jgi:hypothetical protein